MQNNNTIHCLVMEFRLTVLKSLAQNHVLIKNCHANRLTIAVSQIKLVSLELLAVIKYKIEHIVSLMRSYFPIGGLPHTVKI